MRKNKMKPRATQVHQILISKVSAEHEAKHGKKCKRAKQKQLLRKEMRNHNED